MNYTKFFTDNLSFSKELTRVPVYLAVSNVFLMMWDVMERLLHPKMSAVSLILEGFIVAVSFGIVLLSFIMSRYLQLYRKMETQRRILLYQEMRRARTDTSLADDGIYFKSSYQSKTILDLSRIRVANYNLDYQVFTPNRLPGMGELDELFGVDLVDFYEFASTTKKEQQIVMFYWTKRLMAAVRGPQGRYRQPGIKHISFGFEQVSFEGGELNPNNYHFGVIIHVEPALWEYGIRNRSGETLRADGPPLIDHIEVGGYRFPVFLRVPREELHCADLQPIGGTTACLAVPKIQGADIKAGFLTAKHVTDKVIGSPLALNCGHTGYVADLGVGSIDAAFIVCPDCRIVPQKPLVARKSVGIWTEVKIITQRGVIDTIITDNTDKYGFYHDPNFPVFHFMSHYGIPGDSGSLIIEKDTGMMVGIYLAAMVNAGGKDYGLGMHGYQIAETMQLEFYQ